MTIIVRAVIVRVVLPLGFPQHLEGALQDETKIKRRGPDRAIPNAEPCSKESTQRVFAGVDRFQHGMEMVSLAVARVVSEQSGNVIFRNDSVAGFLVVISPRSRCFLLLPSPHSVVPHPRRAIDGGGPDQSPDAFVRQVKEFPVGKLLHSEQAVGPGHNLAEGHRGTLRQPTTVQGVPRMEVVVSRMEVVGVKGVQQLQLGGPRCNLED